jgi:hypothetical protein
VAVEFNIDASKDWFLGEDKFLNFQIFGRDGIAPVDVTGWSLIWVLRKSDNAPDPAILSKATPDDIQIIGDFASDAASSTQRIRIFFANEDIAALKAITYRYSLKRVDDGLAGVLSFGNCTFRQVTAR